MKIVFFGTGSYAVVPLEALLRSRHEVCAVVTRPDRKKGRKMKRSPGPVASSVIDSGRDTELLRPDDLEEEGFLQKLVSYGSDLFIVVDYGKILRNNILRIPSRYCLNLHPSLLPLYRGASPVNRVIMDGRDITGNTVFRMNERMDAGDILIKESVPVSPYENSSELEAKLSEKGALLLLKALDLVEEEEAYFEPQNEEEATYTGKIQRREGLVDWSMSASDIANRVRGLQPWPGAYTFVAERRLKLLSVKKVRKDIRDRMPGEVLSEEPLEVACGRDAVVLEKVQLEGKKALAGPDFARGSSVAEGTVLGKEEDGTK